MRITTLLNSLIIGLFALSIISCSDHRHGHGGHSHDSASKVQQSAPATTHDNIDSEKRDSE